jgi:hypothetical protein
VACSSSTGTRQRSSERPVTQLTRWWVTRRSRLCRVSNTCYGHALGSAEWREGLSNRNAIVDRARVTKHIEPTFAKTAIADVTLPVVMRWADDRVSPGVRHVTGGDHRHGTQAAAQSDHGVARSSWARDGVPTSMRNGCTRASRTATDLSAGRGKRPEEPRVADGTGGRCLLRCCRLERGRSRAIARDLGRKAG